MVLGFTIKTLTIKRKFAPCLFYFLFSGYLYAHPGIGLVYDGDHTIYYTDLNHVWQLDIQTGKTQIYIENVHTHELVLDSEGDLYGEHYWYEASEEKFRNYIWRKRKDSRLQKIREDLEGENLDFGFVRDRAFASYEIRRKNDHFQIARSDSSARTVWHDLHLNRPGWSFVTAKGELLYSDYPKIYSANEDGVKVIAENLSASRFPFSLQDNTHHIYGIWTDQAGTIYTALYGGRQVVRIDADGRVDPVLRTGLLWSPVNGVFDKDNRLWLMEARIDGRVRIRKIDSEDGSGGVSFFLENLMLFGMLLLILGSILLALRLIRRAKVR